MKKLEELIKQFEWMNKYICQVTNQEENKFFVYNGDADEINRMMEEIKSKQVEIYTAIKRMLTTESWCLFQMGASFYCKDESLFDIIIFNK